MRNADEHATTIHSLFTSEYSIAHLYSAYELQENIKNKEEVDRLATIILNRIKQGDLDFDQKTNANANVRDSQYGWGLYHKALALGNLYKAGRYTDSVTIDNIFQSAIEYLEKVPRTKGFASDARIRYLLFLATVNTPEYDNIALQQIAEIFSKGAKTNELFHKRLDYWIQRPRYAESFDRTADMSTEWKELLISRGWKKLPSL